MNARVTPEEYRVMAQLAAVVLVVQHPVLQVCLAGGEQAARRWCGRVCPTITALLSPSVHNASFVRASFRAHRMRHGPPTTKANKKLNYCVDPVQ